MERSARLVLLLATLAATVNSLHLGPQRVHEQNLIFKDFGDALEEMTKMANDLLAQTEENTRFGEPEGNAEMRISGFTSVFKIRDSKDSEPNENPIIEQSAARDGLNAKSSTSLWGPVRVIYGQPDSYSPSRTEAHSPPPDVMSTTTTTSSPKIHDIHDQDSESTTTSAPTPSVTYASSTSTTPEQHDISEHTSETTPEMTSEQPEPTSSSQDVFEIFGGTISDTESTSESSSSTTEPSASTGAVMPEIPWFDDYGVFQNIEAEPESGNEM